MVKKDLHQSFVQFNNVFQAGIFWIARFTGIIKCGLCEERNIFFLDDFL